MAIGGDYLSLQRENAGFAVDIDLDGSAKATTVVKAVRSANHTIYVQRVVLSFVTHVAAKVFAIQDTAGTPVVIAARTDLAAAAGVPDVLVWDFGPIGTAITAGKDLNYVANTAGSGFTARFHVEGYQRLSTTINTGTANTAD